MAAFLYPGGFEAVVVVDSLKGAARHLRCKYQWRYLCKVALP